MAKYEDMRNQTGVAAPDSEKIKYAKDYAKKKKELKRKEMGVITSIEELKALRKKKYGN